MKTAQIFAAVILLGPGLSANAMTLDNYLAEVRKRHPIFEATELAKGAAEDRSAQGDLQLSPILSAKTGLRVDKAPRRSPPSRGQKAKGLRVR